MKEVEVLVELVEDEENVLNTLNQFEFFGVKHTIDIYLYDDLREQLQLNKNGKLMECLRVRQKGEETYLTYKFDHYKADEWVYSDEIETKISDFDKMLMILARVGLKKLVEVDSEKHIYKNSLYEIVYEKVKNLGAFLEVERRNVNSDANIDTIKHEIRDFIKSLNLKVGKELNSGKPELILNKIKQ